MNMIENWIEKIETAEAKYAPYYDLIKEIRTYYKNEKSRNKQNVFWATIETLKPFLYFKAPRPYVEQKEKINSRVAGLACRILEKALAWNLEKFDFDSVIKYVRNDFLLLGCGMAFERYVPTFKKCLTDEKGNALLEVLEDEKVETVYISPLDFLADVDNARVFEECSWVARKVCMSVSDIKSEFGESACLMLGVKEGEKENRTFTVYEIFDKTDGQILYVAKECTHAFLKVVKDVMNLSGFFPMPKPLYCGLVNEDLIPLPDYVELKPLLDELVGVTSRMQLVMQAIKISGCYDNAFPELAQILNKDVTLVALSDFDKLKENGGLKGVIDFAPIEQYITALEVLASRRQDIMSQIYEMTGVSDIMRGTSDKTETATAVAKKTNFGTLRNQERQNDMLRFMTDLLKIKAEMICELFSAERLKMFADENASEEDVALAVALLKTEKLRGMILGLDTDCNFADSGTEARVQANIGAVHQMISGAFGLISSQPLLLGLYRQMILSLAATLPNARIYVPVIEKTFSAIEEDLKKPVVSSENEMPNLAMIQLNQNAQKMLFDHQIKEKEVALKEAELALKAKEQERKAQMDDKQMALQTEIKMQELDVKKNKMK